MPKRSPRMSKAKRERLEEERLIKLDLEERAEKQELIERNNAHSRMLSQMLLGTDRMYNAEGLVSGDFQTSKYMDAECDMCGKQWAHCCQATGRAHSESVEPALSPWRTHSPTSPAGGSVASPTSKGSKRSSSKRSSKRRSLARNSLPPPTD